MATTREESPEDKYRRLKKLPADALVPISMDNHIFPKNQARNLEMQREANMQTVRRIGPAPTSNTPSGANATRGLQIDTMLPAQGPMYEGYGRPTYGTYGGKSVKDRQEGQYGHKPIIAKIEKIANAFAGQNPMSIYVGDISKKGGGHFPPHSTHRNGDQVDIRPVHNLGVNEPVSWNGPNYNQIATMMLIHEIKRQHPNATILFNDPKFVEMGLTKPYRGHDNHLHVNFGRNGGR